MFGRHDFFCARVLNIDAFKNREVPHFHPDSNYHVIEQQLYYLFYQGHYFSVARHGIPFGASFTWRALEAHPDGGEWSISHRVYGDPLKQKLEDLAKRLGAQKRRMMAEQAAEASPAALIPVVKRVVEKRENTDGDKVSRSDSNPVDEALTIDEIKLATSEGRSSLHIQTREKMCRHFLESNGFSESQIANAIGDAAAGIDGGVDLTKPVEVMSFPPPDEMTQYVNSHGFPGNWFDPTSNQTPDALGLSGEGRTLTSFKVPRGQGLLSCSKPIVDSWTNPSNPVSTTGGGKQLFVNDATKKAVISLNKIGI